MKRANQNSRFTVSCTNYYIRHIKFAEANGNAISGTGGSNALTCGSGPLTIYGATRAASSQQTIPGMLMESL